MARGRTTSLTIRLTPAQRQTLLTWQRATTISAGRARRGRIILLMADGRSISDVAATVGISRRFVYHIPSDLVVDHWTSDGESISHRDVLLLHDV